MDKAKAAISEFTGRKGHTTEVDEQVLPAVQQETIKPQRHEETTTAVDREVHQDHYHTTVQPLEDRQVLPEQHTHRSEAVQEKEFRHGDESATRQRLETEAAQFGNTSTTHDTRHTQSEGAAVQGEHVHHHVHETVQPVVNKETIAPEVIHTTKPIHEVHHASSQHHGMSVLPTKTLGDFQDNSGSTRHEEYDGIPKPYNKSMQSQQTDADSNPTQTGVEGPGSHHTGGTGLSGTEPFRDETEGHRVAGSGHHSTGTSGVTGSGIEQDLESRETGQTSSGMSQGPSTTEIGSGTKKPSLMDRINPKVDASGDGKAGFMK